MAQETTFTASNNTPYRARETSRWLRVLAEMLLEVRARHATRSAFAACRDRELKDVGLKREDADRLKFASLSRDAADDLRLLALSRAGNG